MQGAMSLWWKRIFKPASVFWLGIWSMPGCPLQAQSLFRVMAYNVENLFDTRRDSLKQDKEFLPEGEKRWTNFRYWNKLNALSKVIAAVGEDHLADLIGVCEVENDSVMHDLTRRSALRALGYRYVMTDSPDERGIDVALMYQPGSFRMEGMQEIKVPSVRHGFKPTRNILYVKGRVRTGDTLHVMVCHLPSRTGRSRDSDRHRWLAVQRIHGVADSIQRVYPEALILLMGDFNASCRDMVLRKGLPLGKITDSTQRASSDFLFYHIAVNRPGADITGTYRYQGIWNDLDHILVSKALLDDRQRMHTEKGRFKVIDFPFLCEPDPTYGGIRPRRTYQGPLYKGGYSDHLPVVADFLMNVKASAPIP